MHLPKCTKIQIESTNVCNYHCEMCPRLKLEVPLKHMPMSVYRQILKNIGKVKYIDLTGWGEPLLHPQIPEMIKLAKKQSVKVSFTTNASRITAGMVKQLNQSGLDQLTISLDSIEDNSPGHQKSSIVNKFPLFQKRNRKFKIRIQTTLIGQKIAELDAIANQAYEINATELRLIRCDERFYPMKIDRVKEKKIFDYLHKKWRDKLVVAMAQYSISTGLQDFAYRTYRNLMPKHCPKLLTSAYVNVDGYLTPCCSLPHYQIGDLKNDSLEELWKSKGFRKFRRNSRAVCKGCRVLIL